MRNLDLFAQWWLGLLADWSLRWAVLLLLLWLWFAIRQPRSSLLRYSLLCGTLTVGLLIPLVPRWGSGVISAGVAQHDGPSENRPPVSVRDPGGENGALRAAQHDRAVLSTRPSLEPVDAAPPAVAALPRSEPRHSDSPRRPGLVALLAVWVAGVLVFLARLVVGWIITGRWRRRSTQPGPEILRQVEQLRGQMGLWRRARIATHTAIKSPVLLGGLRPMILVPADWTDLPETVQRSCLVHELAHLARCDDWMRLVLQSIRAVFFFHPLVHWAVRRSQSEQELLCDESVVRHGIDAAEYARTLSQFAQSLSAAARPLRVTSGQALPFLSPGSIKSRIRKLMEAPMPPRATFFDRCRFAALTLSFLGVALALGSVQLRAVEPAPPAEQRSDVPLDGETAESADKPLEPDRERPIILPADEELALATLRAVAFLRAEQQQNGLWNTPRLERWKIGTSSLCVLALLRSGVRVKDPQIEKALERLAAADAPTMVYEVSLQTLAFCAADAKKYRSVIQRNVDLLAKGQIAQGEARGGWSYSVARGGFLDFGGDNSNSEFAMWALHDAARAGATVERDVWRSAHDYWRRNQNADGSWAYVARGPGTGSMTTSGIASLIIAGNRLTDFDRQFVPENAPIDRAWDWMADEFAIGHNPRSGNWLLYYLMTLRRAADLSDKRVIGGHDWYREGREFLLQSQDAGGAWKEAGSVSDPLVSTSMALLFLNPPPAHDP